MRNNTQKVPSVPPNWPHPTAEDLKERPNRLINLGRAQDYLFPSNFVKTSKYEWFNFLPKFLLEEFNPKTKVANCYFLLIAILQCIPAISNTQGYPTVLIPLTFVVTVDGVFAAIEDISRHRADTEANSAYTKRYELHSQATEEIMWANINVGDFVKIHSREKIPADIVVISVAEKTTPAQGLCYVETKSLDGETNLKTRQALKGTLAKVPLPLDLSHPLTPSLPHSLPPLSVCGLRLCPASQRKNRNGASQQDDRLIHWCDRPRGHRS
jgi:magnesium-transporting ATPase (P-type)